MLYLKKILVLVALICLTNLFTQCNPPTEQSSNSTVEAKTTSSKEKENTRIDSIKEFVDADSKDFEPTECEIFFDEALIYKFTEKSGTKEYWIYFNLKTQYLLFAPKDEMVNAIVSHTDGSYWVFGTDEHGKKTAHRQQVDEVADERLYDAKAEYPSSNHYIRYTPTGEKWKLESDIGVLKTIVSSGYQMKDKEVGEPGNIYLTTQLPLQNTYQLYGFTKIEGDSHLSLPSVLNGIGEFSKQQLLTKYEQKSKWGDLALELTAYSYTTYYLNVCDYTYYESADNGFKQVKNPFTR